MQLSQEFWEVLPKYVCVSASPCGRCYTYKYDWLQRKTTSGSPGKSQATFPHRSCWSHRADLRYFWIVGPIKTWRSMGLRKWRSIESLSVWRSSSGADRSSAETFERPQRLVKFSILSPARRELEDIINYYNREQPSLGYTFALEAKKTFTRIAEFPEAWHPLSTNTRRCRVKDFPYAVIYNHTKEEIVVLAIMHMRRHPDSWRNRAGSR